MPQDPPPASSRRQDPEYLLAGENDRARPHAYFNQRLESVLLVAGKADALDDLLAQGVTVGTLKAGGVPIERGEEERDEVQRDRERFVIAETEVLVHHAAETLLRLFLAHEGLPPCPWLTLASERNFATFKRTVSELEDDLAEGGRLEGLTEVFFGSSNRTNLQPTPPEDEWHTGARNVAAWLSWYAAHFLDANVYNAAKHGLALQPGEAAFQIGDDPLISASGPSLEYLEIAEDETGRRRWQRTTQWIELERSMAFVFMACRMMKGLMAVGAARYTDASLRHLDLFVEPPLEKVMAGEGIEFTKLSVGLHYYADPANEAPGGGPG